MSDLIAALRWLWRHPLALLCLLLSLAANLLVAWVLTS